MVMGIMKSHGRDAIGHIIDVAYWQTLLTFLFIIALKCGLYLEFMEPFNYLTYVVTNPYNKANNKKNQIETNTDNF